MTSLLTPTESTKRGTAAETAHPDTRERRVLVVVDDACTTPEVCAGVRSYADDRPLAALVIAPAHESVATQWYVDEDAARADAAYRLRGCIACLRREGMRVEGHIGDSDPVHAIADALREFPADEILFVSAPQRPSRWLRPNVIDRARHSFPQPIEHIAMPPAVIAGSH
ncbi:MAG TPA: hypothetical protein VIR59_10945 [Gaiellaceae bacterium]